MNEYGIVGCCTDMCPKRERIRREAEMRLHKFEISNDTGVTGYPRADPNKCVKEFVRTSPGQSRPKAWDVRPPAVLRSTLCYLFDKILCRNETSQPWIAVYDFVFDRLRSIRQDFAMQHTWNHRDTIYVIECAVRFHICSIFRLCEEPITVFDPHINAVHLQECLKRLLVSYQENGDDGFSPKRRAEMEAFYILFNLGSNDAIRHALTLPPSLLNEATLKTALKLNTAFLNRNYVRVFRLISTLPFLCCAAVMRHIPSIRKCMLQVMSHGYSSKNCKFPLVSLQQLLLFECISETREECKYYGIGTDSDSVQFVKQTFKISQPTMPLRQFRFIKEKHNKLQLSDVLYG